MIFECHESPRSQGGKRKPLNFGRRAEHARLARVVVCNTLALATLGPCLGECRTSGTITITSARAPQTRGLTVVAMTALAISATRRTWKTRADRTTYSFHGLITSSPCFLGVLVLGTQVSPLEMTWNMDDFPAPANMDL